MSRTARSAALFAYLWCVGVVAVNIHIVMLKSGVPYPGDHFSPPVWYAPLSAFLQLTALYWLLGLVKQRFTTFGMVRQTLILFILMAALMELFVRLPATAGYVNGQSYLFTWVASYLPEMITLLIACGAVVCLGRWNRWGWPVALALLAVFAAISVHWVTPIIFEQTSSLLQWLTPPDPQKIIPSPYDWQTSAIASALFVEPVLSCFAIALLSWNSFPRRQLFACLQFTAAILLLNKGLVKFVVFLLYTDLPWPTAVLSIGQFTFEWVFVCGMIALAVFFLFRTEQSSEKLAAGR